MLSAMETGRAWPPLRNQVLKLARASGESHIAEIEAQLDSLGPHGLWCEVCRSVLADSAIFQSGDESFAETIARALGISIDELRILMARGQISSVLVERFGEAH
jgi:hypothetical protein